MNCRLLRDSGVPASNLPSADDRDIARCTKPSDTDIYRASVPLTITVMLQEPLARARSKDADLTIARPVPIAGYRQVLERGETCQVGNGQEIAAVPTNDCDALKE